jgi:hypothetical protein
MTRATQLLYACRTPVDEAGTVLAGGHPAGVITHTLVRFIQGSESLDPTQVHDVSGGATVEPTGTTATSPG